jgi:polar amino acid transport system substrate-binding protein
MKLRGFGLVVASAVLLAACGTTSGGTGSATPSPSKIAPPPASELLTANTLTICSDVSYPPQEYYDPPGSQTATGFDIELAKAIADRMGLQLAVVNQGFNGIIPALGAKKCDAIVSAMTISADRKKAVDFLPYFVAGESFVVKKGSSFQPTKLADLCGHKVAVEDGTAEKDEVNTSLNAAGMPCAANKVQLQVFGVDTEALAQLKKDAVDVHFTDSPVGQYEVKKDSALALSGSAIEVSPEGIAVRLGDAAMLDPIKAAFKALQDDGSYKSLLTKWGVQDGDIAKAS